MLTRRLPFLLVLGLAFLYAPIALIIGFSFNAGRYAMDWQGFSVQWYGKAFSNPLIVEALADAAQSSRDTAVLVEYVRRALGRTLTTPLVDERGVLKAVALDPQIEDELTGGLVGDAPNGRADGISAQRAREILEELRKRLGDQQRPALELEYLERLLKRF